MKPSPNRTPMSQRSKGICTIAALAVGFGCAVFGVGGADGGTRAYARHVREAQLEARMAGLALAHRSPEQVVLAIRPKVHAAHAAATQAAVTQAPAAPAVTTTSTAPAITTTTPATTTTATTSTTPSTTTSSTVAPSENASESATSTNPVTTGTTTTGTTTTGAITTTGTTTNGTTTTGTTTTGTTTTGTTTTATTTTGAITTTGTTTTGNGTSSTTGHGHGATTTTATTTPVCHGRCETVTGNTGAVSASEPSTSSSSTGTNFPFTDTALPTVTPATSGTSTTVNDSSTGSLNPTSSTTPTASTTPTSSGPPTSSGSGTSGSSGNSNITLIPFKLSSSSSIGHLSHSSGSHTSVTGPSTTGTGAAAGGATTGPGPAGTTGAGTAAAGTTAAAHTHTVVPRGAKHPTSGGSAFAPLNSGVQVIDHFVNVIPTAVWVALGAAFTLMLAFAGVAFRSSRRARRRENEFAAISAAALTDALTGILNRRGFTEAAEREFARASRYDRPFVLAYVDVRGLKAVNDTEGHLMGDELIKTVAGLMKESARADDVVGRIGGDEFALLLAEQTAESADPVIRRIRARVAEARAAMEISVPWELTIGVASFPDDGGTVDELLDVADRRLYEQRGIALR
jgi:diguanylate cyclase (GGDEF)-like protein